MDNCDSTPTQGTKPSYDPGWNDPPKLSYNGQQPTPNRPRNFLNKRVAFPLSNTPSSTPAPQPVNLPPMPTLIPPVPPIQSMRQPTQNEEIEIDSNNTLKEVKDILLEFLESSSELGPKGNDIKRRISVMEDMWISGKLNKSIHIQMKELAYAIRDDQPNKADEIHRALMVDHVSGVGSWMPGIKQLIHHCVAKSELLAFDKE
ncbi:steroid receptor RNA activator 1 [Bombyx mori]|uniref:SRA1/Sec31 domain-containing protein n=1 Tax=Bombyx mori TaxID=7091 RepID=A0A8R1WIB9_BOMMO|nr:steroid receptor RNA activator 1 [Bombyx mori]